MTVPANRPAPRRRLALLTLALLGCVGWIIILQTRLDRALAAAALREKAPRPAPPLWSPPPHVSSAPSDTPPTAPSSSPAASHASIDALWDAPEYQAVLAAAARDTLARRYEALWERLALAPELRERARHLLAERQLRALDLVRAARAQGLPDTDIHALLDQADEQIETNLRLVLGPEAHAAFRTHERQLDAHDMVERFTREIGRAAAPLSTGQSEALLRIFAERHETSAPGDATPATDPMLRVLGGLGAAETPRDPPGINPDTLEAARAVLDPAQLEILARLGRIPSATP